MSSAFSFPIKPVPFLYLGDDDRTLPDLSDEELDDLVAVLKALARSSYPRLEAVPIALNAYNCNQKTDDNGQRPWAYFYPITIIPPARLDGTLPRYPEIRLDFEICQDLKRRWRPIRYGWGYNSRNQSTGFLPPARYRFLCFIHKHRIDRKNILQKGVHTISIWDREWDELTWHDTYHVDRTSRRKDIREFWKHVNAPGFIDEIDRVDSREDFMSRIRYRTVYHICEHIEETLRSPVPPRHTIYAVMSTALFHMNNARDPQVSIVPDRLELFGGQHKGLLPQFFAHLLCLCLDVQPDWSLARQKRFVLQFRILERLRWMRLRTRECLELYGGDRDGDYSVDDGEGDDGGREWMYEILNIP
ncbi:hypothetical protein F4814DRAFT_440737 [Daldinia grandis]|nr:hypothetical protein F4814DRAFT_440737 [Daldinia grandis]